MSLLTLFRPGLVGLMYRGPVMDDSNDRIEDGEPFLAVQIGQRSGLPLVLPHRGTCESEFAEDRIIPVHQVGAYSAGVPLKALPLAQCDGDELPQDIPLLGVQIGGVGTGVPLVFTFCEKCNGSCCFCSSRYDFTPNLLVTVESDAHPSFDYTVSMLAPYASRCRGSASVSWAGGGIFGNYSWMICSLGQWQMGVYLVSTGHFPGFLALDTRLTGDIADFLVSESCSPFIRVYQGIYQYWNYYTSPTANGFHTSDASYVGADVTATITVL